MPVILVPGWQMKDDQEFSVILSHILSLRPAWTVSHPFTKNNPRPPPPNLLTRHRENPPSFRKTVGSTCEEGHVMETVGRHGDIKDFCGQEPIRSWDPQSSSIRKRISPIIQGSSAVESSSSDLYPGKDTIRPTPS